MTSKDEFKKALKKLGFVQDKNTRSAGSHLRWHHIEYPSIIIGIADHKNTKEISQLVRQDLINTLALVVWLKFQDGKHNFQPKLAMKFLECINTDLSDQILQRAKRIDFSNYETIANAMPRRLLQEIVKRNKTLTSEAIVNSIKK